MNQNLLYILYYCRNKTHNSVPLQQDLDLCVNSLIFNPLKTEIRASQIRKQINPRRVFNFNKMKHPHLIYLKSI
jgi:hypothetical protein